MKPGAAADAAVAGTVRVQATARVRDCPGPDLKALQLPDRDLW